MIQPYHFISTFIHPCLRDFCGNDLLKKQAFEALQSAIALVDNTFINKSVNRNESAPSLLTNDSSASFATSNLLTLCYDKPCTDKTVIDEVLLWSRNIFDANTINDDDLLFREAKRMNFQK